MGSFSHSRLSTFNQCPRKHRYMYEEQIFTDGNEFLILGNLFHKCIEAYYKGEDYTKYINEYETKVKIGAVTTESGMLEDVVTRYLAYYKKSDDEEEVIMNEKKITVDFDDGDTFSMVVDRLVNNDTKNLIILRDTKTTTSRLKYTPSQVKYNQQLLTYIAIIQEQIESSIDAYEIDEVRLAKIQPVPMNANGKPTADKKRLGLVLYEDYYNKLCEMGLDTAPEYQNILEALEKRGHPLFKRTTAHLLNQDLVVENLNDLDQSYKSCKSGDDRRIRGPLCDYCAYKPLCELDYYNPNDEDREIIINKIKKST